VGGIIVIWLVIVVAATWGGYALGRPKRQEIPGLLIGLGTSLVGVLIAGILGGLLLGGLGIVIIVVALPHKGAVSGAGSGPGPAMSTGGDGSAPSLTKRLEELDALHRSGRISDEEHKAARARLLGG
jgi:hypothetical protein